MNTLPVPKPLVVVILDGWGLQLAKAGNAIAMADTPVMDSLTQHYPVVSLAAAGLEVGLPSGLPGNSETGHRNIGAGRVEYQILASIDRSIEDEVFSQNPAFLEAIDHARRHSSQLHLMGLASSGSVHSSLQHLYALLELLAQQNFREPVFLHLFTDGRDTPPQSAAGFLKAIQDAIGRYGVGRIASVTGRFYAMDRNNNWKRTEATYNMLTGGKRAPGSSTPEQAIERSYAKNDFDEMIIPTSITRGGSPIATIKDNDAVIFFNFRPDRARQLTQAFVNPDMVGFKLHKLTNIYFTAMTAYYPEISSQIAFSEDIAERPMTRVLSDAGLRQLHVAETEKYAHITYYLSVGHEQPFPGEDHKLVTSSSVRNFSQEPGMGAVAITDHLLAAIKKKSYDVYFVNYANADMVGHTGDFAAAQVACATIDQEIGRLHKAIETAGGALIITSDHGNAEAMIDPFSQQIETEHTGNPVPFYYVRSELKRSLARSDYDWEHIVTSPVGVLADVAPTVLDILQLQKPLQMTGVSLLGSLL